MVNNTVIRFQVEVPMKPSLSKPKAKPTKEPPKKVTKKPVAKNGKMETTKKKAVVNTIPTKIFASGDTISTEDFNVFFTLVNERKIDNFKLMVKEVNPSTTYQ